MSNLNKIEATETDRAIEVVETLNEMMASVYQSYLSDDSPYVDFVGSFQYGDADIDDVYHNLSFTEGHEPITKYLESLATDSDRFQFLEPYCTVETAFLHSVDGEILSFAGHETDVESGIDPETLTALSVGEISYIKKHSDNYIDDDLKTVYINLSDVRWALILDIQAAIEAISDEA